MLSYVLPGVSHIGLCPNNSKHVLVLAVHQGWRPFDAEEAGSLPFAFVEQAEDTAVFQGGEPFQAWLREIECCSMWLGDQEAEMVEIG